MNTTLLCLVALLPADAPATGYPALISRKPVIRAQTDGYEEPVPFQDSPMYEEPGYGNPNSTFSQDPSAGSYLQPTPDVNAPLGQAPLQYDPFIAGSQPVGQPGPVGPFFNRSGPQPYKFGWSSRYDIGWLPSVSTKGPLNNGDFGVFEVDAAWQYTTPLSNNWIFSATPSFGYRAWDGPETGTRPGLPGSVYHFGADLVLATPMNGGWSVEAAFTPSINSSLESGLGRDAWHFDGRAIGYYQATPTLMLAMGAGYWDRVRDRVIPYAGVVWAPNPRWEFRLLFPESRISWYLGNDGMDKWLYARAEYHVEAYEVDLSPGGGESNVEVEDYRILLGLRADTMSYSFFVEAGWVFGRDVEFSASAPGFDPSTGFIARSGIRF